MASNGEDLMNEKLGERPRLGLRWEEEEFEDETEAGAMAVPGLVDNCVELSLVGGFEGGGFTSPGLRPRAGGGLVADRAAGSSVAGGIGSRGGSANSALVQGYGLYRVARLLQGVEGDCVEVPRRVRREGRSGGESTIGGGRSGGSVARFECLITWPYLPHHGMGYGGVGGMVWGWWLGFNLGGSDAMVWKSDDAGLWFGVALGEGGAGWKLEEEDGVWEVGWRCRWKCKRERGPLVMVMGGDGGGSGGPPGPLD